MQETMRDPVNQPVTLEYFQRRWAEGWQMSAIEWQREGETRGSDPEASAGTSAAPALPVAEAAEEVPYGLRIARDCLHLEANPDEMAIMMVILQEIVKDQPFSLIAEHLNGRRLKTRGGREWTPADVFELMPRLIDAGPQLLKSSEWPARRLEVLRRAI